MSQRHHVVPQFYLRNFSIAGTRSAVYAYTREGKVEQRNTHSVAYGNNFYDSTDKDGNANKDLEPAFSTVESDAKPILDKLVTDEAVNLGDEEMAKLAYFIATLYTRGKAYRNKTGNVLSSSIKAMMAMQAENKESFHITAKKIFGDHKSAEQIERVRLRALKGEFDIEHDSNDLLRQSLMSAHTIYPVIKSKNYYLLKAVPGHFFITSDNPVTIHHSSRAHKEISGAGGVANSTIALPLNQSHCLMMDYREIETECKEAAEGLIDELNYLQAFYANEMLFSHIQSDRIKDLFMKTHPGDGQAIITTYGDQITTTR